MRLGIALFFHGFAGISNGCFMTASAVSIQLF